MDTDGTTIVRAAFEHSYFVHPDRVRQRTPFYPDRARLSREHYPKRDRGDRATYKGREVKLGDNSAAQRAWARYSARRIERASGYGVRQSGDIPGVRTRSRPDGIFATCRSGRAC